MSSKLKNILAFAKLGIAILPLEAGGKRPVSAGGAKAAVSDPKLLTRLCEKHRDYNYGVVPSGGIFILRTASNQARDLLIASHPGSKGHLPKTVTLRIDGERSYLFSGRKARSSHDKLGKGIHVYGEDDLGENDYVLGSGSKLKSGTRCRFVQGRGLGEVNIAKCPQWLADLVTGPSAGERPTTKADLFSIAKIEIERGEDSWRKAAEALARAEKECGATQREMAEAVGRSASWVNRLLQWSRSGYKDGSPFGPTTQAGRVLHAKRKKRAKSPPEPDTKGDGDDTKPTEDSGEKGWPTTTLDATSDIPPFLDRRPLSHDDQHAYDAIMAVWTSCGLQSMCCNASAVVRERFIAEIRAITLPR